MNKENKIWVVSDTHFSHVKLDEWAQRSGNWQNKLWIGLEAIPAGDILFHLGDICIGDDLEVHQRLAGLPCKKVLIRGNHDKKSLTWYMNNGWYAVVDAIEIVYRGHYLHLTHRPQRPQGHNTYNIHGHTHGNMHRSEEYCDYYDKQYHIDISPEVVGYSPIRLDTMIDKLKK
jgi:calcineurin-like phosphoesterase family protein